MNSVARVLLAVSAVALGAAGAQATTLQYTYTFGQPTGQTLEIGNAFSLTGFASSLGTLTGVTIDYDFGLHSSGTVTNTSANTAKLTVVNNSIATIAFGGSYVATGDDAPTLNGSYLNVSFNNVASGASRTYAPADTYQSDSLYFDGSDYALSHFVNHNLTGNFSTSSESGVLISGGANGLASLTTLGHGSVTITYDYIEAVVPDVPEPASWAMMLVGFGAMGTVMRGRRPARTFA